MLTHLQSDQVPRKSVDCLKDIVPMLKTINEVDVQEACNLFDFENEFYTCLGTSGKTTPSPPPPDQSLVPSAVQDGNSANGRPLWEAIIKATQVQCDGLHIIDFCFQPQLLGLFVKQQDITKQA